MGVLEGVQADQHRFHLTRVGFNPAEPGAVAQGVKDCGFEVMVIEGFVVADLLEQTTGFRVRDKGQAQPFVDLFHLELDLLKPE